ncbi:hypothetical protein LWC35_33275 [Pseudonocardia kujensis]|uniref:acyl-CoA dehydrogenase family protein n=1 Tax=Pseudonocardia kujensis TaxID=1128675 RepID=UPI001E5BEC74|nr:acyl-CoA dehydrogenase family protein [Pseudonocardia kujensis]MCE0767734.1 hypothetical protein [Pseudonocardia kujensis]
MSTLSGLDRTEVPVPEPDLTPAEMIARAESMKPKLRSLQDDFERRGSYSEEVHQEFQANGFYRILQPRRFGGYEFDVTTFWKVMVKIAEGDPGTGWCLALASHHALVIGSGFTEQAQREIFGPNGDFRAPHRVPPMGSAVPTEGGYIVNGTWDYCSGMPYSTHFMGNATVSGGDDAEQHPSNIVVVIPRGQVTMLDDWGGGRLLGLQSSGSNSVVVENVFVPTHWTCDWEGMRAAGPNVGTELHPNPMYLGVLRSVYHAGLAVSVVGAARAAVDELEELITTKETHFPPRVPRYTHPDHQRAFGLASVLADSAEALIYRVGDVYMERCQRWADTGQPFDQEDDVQLYTILQQAGQLAARAVDEVFSIGSSSAVKRGQRLQRYYRDAAMYRSHISAQYLGTATERAKLHFGLPHSLPS